MWRHWHDTWMIKRNEKSSLMIMLSTVPGRSGPKSHWPWRAGRRASLSQNQSQGLQRRSQRQAPRQRQQPILMRMELSPRQRQRRRFRPVGPSRMTYSFLAIKVGDLLESVLWSMWWQAYRPQNWLSAKTLFYNSIWFYTSQVGHALQCRVFDRVSCILSWPFETAGQGLGTLHRSILVPWRK